MRQVSDWRRCDQITTNRRRSPVSRHTNYDAGSLARYGTNVQGSIQFFHSRRDVGKSESSSDCRPIVSNAGPVVSDLQKWVWWLRSEINANDSWLGMANRVTDCFLSNSQEILPNRGWQAFFGYAGRMKITGQ